MNTPQYKTKIVAGKLVTVPVFPSQAYRDNDIDNDFRRKQYTNTHQIPSHGQQQQEQPSRNARLEAQRNKARALHQTYHSVLDPEPRERGLSPIQSNPFVIGIVSGIVSQSRHKLLSTLSSMRRRDPSEHGLVTPYDAQDVFTLHNLNFDDRTKYHLLEQYTVNGGMVDYRNMWKFVMDCYSKKDQIDLPTRESHNHHHNDHHKFENQQQRQHHLQRYSHMNNNNDYRYSNSPDLMKPGLTAELEFELRQYARSHQKRLETNLLEGMFHTLDKHGTGRLLKSQVQTLCEQYLHGIDRNVILSTLTVCDAGNTGMVSYQEFLRLVKTAQPTYLPPLSTSAPNLINIGINHRKELPQYTRQESPYKQLVHEEKEIIDYLHHISSPRNQRKDILGSNYLHKVPNHFDHHQQFQENEEVGQIPKGHSQQLEALGMIGVHLSDFETEVHQERKATDTEAEQSEKEEESTHRPATYDLGPRQRTFDGKGDRKYGSSPSRQRSMHTGVQRPRSSNKTPTPFIKKSPLRKTWENSTKVSQKKTNKWGTPSSQKVEKWWKEGMLLSEGITTDDDATLTRESSSPVSRESPSNKTCLPTISTESPLVVRESSSLETSPQRKKWGDSHRIKTMKGKRRKKLAKSSKKSNKSLNNTSSESEQKCNTDFDSEFYTTTDVEIGEIGETKRRHHQQNIEQTSSMTSSPQQFESVDKFVSSNKPNDEKTTIENELVYDENTTLTAVKLTEHSKNGNDSNPDSLSDKKTFLKLNDKSKEGSTVNMLPSSIPADSSAVKSKDTDMTDVTKALELQSLYRDSQRDDNPSSKPAIVEILGRRYELFPNRSASFNDEESNHKKEYALQLDWVYGFDSLVGIEASSTNQVLFTCGRVAVTMDTKQHNQRFFRKHSQDITCFALQDDTAATVQFWDGKKCIVYVWSTVDMATISTLYVDQYEAAIFKKIAFLSETLLVAIIESGGVNLGCIFNVKDSDPVSTTKIPDAFNGITTYYQPTATNVHFVIFGKDECRLCFYEYNNNHIISNKAANFGTLPKPKSITFALFSGKEDLLTGDSNGTILLWKRTTLQIERVVNNAHASWISSMCISQTGILFSSGNRDGVVKAWSRDLKQAVSIVSISNYSENIRNMTIFNETIFLGTGDNNILKMSIELGCNDPLREAKDTLCIVNEGQDDVISGLATDPIYKESMCSLSADGTLYTINVQTKSGTNKTSVKGNGSCVCYHPCKEYTFIGCKDGSIHLLASVTGVLVDKFKDVYTSITCIQLSCDGSKLACGSSNGYLLIYHFDDSAKILELLLKTKIFGDEVHGIDWTYTCHVVRLESASLQMVLYDVMGKREIQNNEKLNWSSMNCLVNYQNRDWLPTWDSNATTNELKVAHHTGKGVSVRANRDKLVLSPFSRSPIKHEKTFTTSSCYASFNPSDVQFSCDGSYVFVAYEKSSCLWQWKLVER
ncbi:echinoderm microtubule-associated protein-like 4 isoform X2 [Clytia hemisphaerica]|uniref:echinoderm microtubule-associated protein-like 4 isoform X2 n=1 Tax=Clytia hemisphaerica TaxID=252671 RepID=UPI0034D63CE0